MIKHLITLTNSLLPERYRNDRGTWGMIAGATISAVGSYVGSSMSGGGGSMPPTPEHYEDADYRETQDYLKGYGMDIMGGNIPEYYKPIGETGSRQFEGMLDMTKRDITQSTSEAMAKGGRARGGQLAASTAGAVGDASTKLRYDDYNRAMSGKLALLGIGTNVVGGVRDAGQRYGEGVNKFNWNQYNAMTGQYMQGRDEDRESDENQGAMWGSIGSIATNVVNALDFGGGGDGFSNQDILDNVPSNQPTYLA